MEPVRVGIIGCGVIGRSHVGAALAADEVSLVAVADLIPERAAEQAARGQGLRAYGEGHELIADPDIEAVVLAMPAVDRRQIGCDAFAAGKHVLTEKPPSRSVAELDKLIAARGDLVGACCSSRYRFLESADIATAFVATGALGPIRVIRCRGIVPAGAQPSLPRPPWRLSHELNGGGILANWGVYDLDYLLGILGWKLEPTKLLAGCWRVPPEYDSYAAPGSDAETHVAFSAQCADGSLLHYERAEFIAAEGGSSWEILGTHGSLGLAMLSGARQIAFTRAVPGEGVAREVLFEGADPNEALVHNGPVADFARAIRTGEPPKTSLEQARLIQRIIDAAYRSQQSGDVAVP